ncbi:MAG: TIGR00297 family protein [Candidatus Diapherotrites archaeon CG10_big_fil_rev_8_21_14_0_10_31_34]|nr:MAG: TIGR00297 family protein [Candidatus Diapherotrites archaeon CG10_big_fil_rev_8_21_14_0_10_31_34]
MLSFSEILIILIVMAFFIFISVKKKSFDRKGILIGILIGLITIFLGQLNVVGGLTAFLFIAYFFFIGELGTRYRVKKTLKEHEKRSTGNVLGNSLAAVIALALNFPIGFFAGISAALADTLSSEVGMLSTKKPLLITTFKEVETGTDGGITVLGCISALIGAGLIASMHYLLYSSVFFAGIILLAGLIGTFIDSILGALFERKGKLSNTYVNLISTLIAVVFAVIVTL